MCQFGYLSLIKKLLAIALIYTLIISFISTNKPKICLYHKDINGDSIFSITELKCVITVIDEPACTGCKENLLTYSNKLNNKIKVYNLLNWRGDIVERKNYRDYILKLNPNSTLIYSLNIDSTVIKINDKVYKLNKTLSPYQLWVFRTDNELKVNEINYKFIFSETTLSQAYLDSFNSFF